MNRSASTWSTGWSRRDCHGPDLDQYRSRAAGRTRLPALDLQYGDEQNDFELTHSTPGLLLSDGCYIGAEDTEFGGRVDAVRITVDDGHALYTLTGRTWHGLLAGKILQPDSGADRLTVSGDANSIIRTVISRIGLSTVFDVPSEASGITLSNYSFRRYITAWDGCA